MKRSPMAKTILGRDTSDVREEAVEHVSDALRPLLADVFTLYVKTKNFHWHMTGRSFRDYHRMLDEQAAQLLAMTDPIAERARKLGGTAIRSIGDIARHQCLKDNNREEVDPQVMLEELLTDNRQFKRSLYSTHEICERHGDVATAGLIENWIDETEGRAWFLAEILGDR